MGIKVLNKRESDRISEKKQMIKKNQNKNKNKNKTKNKKVN